MDARKIAILSTIGIVLLGTAGIGIAAWRLRQAPAAPPATTDGLPGADTSNGGAPSGQAGVGESGTPRTILRTPSQPYLCNIDDPTIDCDLDGLTNAEEAKAKTDPKAPDTDKDNVPDGAEVKTWKSDPLNPRSIDPSMSDYDAIAAGKRGGRPVDPAQP